LLGTLGTLAPVPPHQEAERRRPELREPKLIRLNEPKNRVGVGDLPVGRLHREIKDAV
jgi:hypothetical protein